jgi:hypothetical protein
MSVGIINTVIGVNRRITNAITMNVYGRLKANATIHMNWNTPASAWSEVKLCRAVRHTTLI